MIRRTLPVMLLLLLVGPWSHWARAQSIPTAIPYTGSVAVSGVPFNGSGQFKFAIVTETGASTLWSNDNTSNAGGEPQSGVTVPVSNGLYALELGDPDRMQTIPAIVFNSPSTFLRVWFSDGVNGFQQLAPDRQLVSVPYAYQSERAREVSGTGTVVKSIAAAGGTPLTDAVVLEHSGNIDIQQNGNTITIVGTSGNAAATDLSCLANPCVSPAEISGTLTAAQVPDLGSLRGTLSDAQIPDLNALSGVLLDSQIPASIARDNEVTGGVSAAISAHVGTNNAHPLSTYTAGTLAEARIDDAIARDAEVAGAIAAHSSANDAHALSSFTTGTLAAARIDPAIARDSEVTSAITAHAIAADAHALSSFTTGTLAEARIDSAVARDSEVPGLVGTTIQTAINTHVATANAHPLGSYTAGTLDEARIDQAIARDTEVQGLISTHASAQNAHLLSSFTTGTLSEARIDQAIARDSEVAAAVAAISNAAATDVVCATPCITSAEISGPLTDALIPDLNTLSGVLLDGQIPAAITRDSEVPGLIGTAVSDAIAAHSVAPGAHTLSTLAGSVTDAQVPDLQNLSGVLTDTQIPQAIARDDEVAAAVAAVANAAATDVTCTTPCVSPAEISGPLTDALIPDLNTLSGVLTPAQIPTTITHDLNVTGTVTVASLNAGYGRVVRNNLSAPTGATTTLNAQCSNGSLLSGGYELDALPAGVAILGSWPASGNSWSVKVDNQSGSPVDVNLYAVCAAIQ